jgi:hypothetical protein
VRLVNVFNTGISVTLYPQLYYYILRAVDYCNSLSIKSAVPQNLDRPPTVVCTLLPLVLHVPFLTSGFMSDVQFTVTSSRYERYMSAQSWVMEVFAELRTPGSPQRGTLSVGLSPSTVTNNYFE